MEKKDNRQNKENSNFSEEIFENPEPENTNLISTDHFLMLQSVEIEEWKRMQLIYQSALKEIGTKLEILNSEFQLAHCYNPIEHITSRIKSPESIAKKLRHQGRPVTVENIVRYINDVAGVRIICSFTSDIYRIAELIRRQSDVTVLKIKDYLNNPKENGYSSYHMIVSVPIFLAETTVDTKVEIQIRTIAMDFWASLEHKMYYKFEGNAPENIRRELKECADLVSFLDRKMLAINEEIQKYSEAEPDREVLSEQLKGLFGKVNEENEGSEHSGRTKQRENVIDIPEEELIRVVEKRKRQIFAGQKSRSIGAVKG